MLTTLYALSENLSEIEKLKLAWNLRRRSHFPPASAALYLVLANRSSQIGDAEKALVTSVVLRLLPASMAERAALVADEDDVMDGANGNARAPEPLEHVRALISVLLEEETGLDVRSVGTGGKIPEDFPMEESDSPPEDELLEKQFRSTPINAALKRVYGGAAGVDAILYSGESHEHATLLKTRLNEHKDTSPWTTENTPSPGGGAAASSSAAPVKNSNKIIDPRIAAGKVFRRIDATQLLLVTVHRALRLRGAKSLLTAADRVGGLTTNEDGVVVVCRGIPECSATPTLILFNPLDGSEADADAGLLAKEQAKQGFFGDSRADSTDELAVEEAMWSG